jgi:ATP-dependent Clp protease ATP-binding subunit ClpC
MKIWDPLYECMPREDLEQLQLERLRSGWDRANSPVVTADDIAEVVSMWTGVPVMQIAQEESQRLLHMEDDLDRISSGSWASGDRKQSAKRVRV